MDFMKMAKGHVYRKNGVEWDFMEFDDGIPRRFVDENGVTMIVHFPGMTRPRGVVRVFVALNRYKEH